MMYLVHVTLSLAGTQGVAESQGFNLRFSHFVLLVYDVTVDANTGGYLTFLYFLNVPKNNTSKGVTAGFATCPLFVFLTILAAIATQILYGTSLADSNWLHGSAESLGFGGCACSAFLSSIALHTLHSSQARDCHCGRVPPSPRPPQIDSFVDLHDGWH